MILGVLVMLVVGLGTGTAAASGAGPYRTLMPLWEQGAVSKAGVGDHYGDCANLRALGATWYQNWTPHPEYCGDDLRALAMVWSWHPGEPLPEIAPWAWAVELGNEPNLPTQGNMTVAETAELSWRAASAWPRMPKISPATLDDACYLYQVYEEHERRFGVPPAWDYLAAHCYYPTAEACIAHIEDLLTLGRNWDPPRRVFVTEWAILPCAQTTTGVCGQPDMARAQFEATKLRAWFEANPDIVAHLWFASEYNGAEWWSFQPHAACDTSLVHGGQLTAWGRWFAGQ